MAGSIERRLRRLEPVEEPQARGWLEVIVKANETREDALHRQFGDQGPPEWANFIFWQLVEPAPRPAPPMPEPAPVREPAQMGRAEIAALLNSGRQPRYR